MNPSIVIPILGGGLGSLPLGDGPLGEGGAGNLQVEHTLGRVPYAAIPVAQSGGLIRLRSIPAPYDATYVYLSISAADVNGFVAVW